MKAIILSRISIHVSIQERRSEAQGKGAGEREMDTEGEGFAGSFDWKCGDKAFRSWDLALQSR